MATASIPESTTTFTRRAVATDGEGRVMTKKSASKTETVDALRSFDLKFSVLVASMAAHGHRIHDAFDSAMSPETKKYSDQIEDLHTQWMFIEAYGGQLDNAIANFEVNNYDLSGVEQVQCDLEGFCDTAELIVGDAIEAVGIACPDIHVLRAADAMVNCAKGLHKELTGIIEAGYWSRRQRDETAKAAHAPGDTTMAEDLAGKTVTELWSVWCRAGERYEAIKGSLTDGEQDEATQALCEAETALSRAIINTPSQGAAELAIKFRLLCASRKRAKTGSTTAMRT
jgi:hypothetical protein